MAAILVALMAAAWASGSDRIILDFETAEVGKPPPGFVTARTGTGAEGVWVIREDGTAPSGGRVLEQASADPTGSRFPTCVYDELVAQDVSVSVRFKASSGEIDRAAGIVWRYRDPANYYVVRANALEDNVVLYKVENGKRNDLKPVGAWPLAYGKKAEVAEERWNELRVVARGDRFAVHLNGTHLFDVEDRTFAGAGKVGLWTKADSVTRFDDLRITVLEGASGR